MGKESNPLRIEPDYIVQCSEDGSFHFTHLSFGTYRIMAVRDRYRDRLYQRGEDEYGIPFTDVLLTKDNPVCNQDLPIRLTREDTLGPSMVHSMALHQNHVLLKFDEYVTLKALSGEITIVSKQDSTDTLRVIMAYIDPVDRKTLCLITDSQSGEKSYSGKIQGIMDFSGNPLDSLSQWFEFQGLNKPDTVQPKLVQTVPKHNSKNVPLNKIIHLIFDEALDTLRFSEGFALTDTHNVRIPVSLKWESPADIVFVPDSVFTDKTIYRIHLKGDCISDLSGNSLTDTTFQFQTINEDTLSEISGFVFDPDSNALGPIKIRAYQTADTSISYNLTLSEPGEFQFLKILPGLYKLEIFRDRNGNGIYDYGNPIPFIPSERFTVYPDTIKVRSRWPNAGNDIHLP
jgi:uncharacterized protein (DUF2141 family)